MDPQIRQLAESLGILSSTVTNLTAAQEAMLQGLVQVNNANQAAANSTLKSVNARTIENELLAKREERERALISVFQQLGSGIVRSISGLGNFTAQLYTTSSIFDTAKVTFTALADITKDLSKIISNTLGIFGRWGSSAGAIFERIVNSGVDIALNALKNRIEQAQIISDTFTNMGKAGATFGGSLDKMIEAARSSQLNLQEFGKFVAGNLQNLTGYGQSVSQSAAAIGRLTVQVANLDPALLVLKGSYGDLAASTAEYMALQRQIGIAERTDSEQTRNSVRNYIRLQNELSEITGRSAAEQKRAEEQRRQVAAYQMAASKLEGDARTNIMGLMTLFDQMGPDMASAMQEFFANNGQMINAQNITFATMNKEMFDMGVQMLSAISQPTDEFKKSIAATAQGLTPAIRASQATMDQTGLLMLAGSKVGGDVVGMLGRTTAAMVPFLNNLEKLPEVLNKLVTEASGSAGGTTGTLRTGIDLQNQLKKKIDELAIANLAELPKIIEATGKISLALVSTDTALNNLARRITSGNGVLNALEQFKTELTAVIAGIFGPGTTRPTTGRAGLGQQETSALQQRRSEIETLRQEQNALMDRITNQLQAGISEQGTTLDSNTREALEAEIRELSAARIQLITERNRIDRELGTRSGRQEGGIATEPTIVGENNQPEAVIPLARGNIPLNINFEPMIRIMEQQREYLEEILRSTDNNADYLERIYHATA